MTDRPAGFFEGTEMPTAGWWEALWPDPATVLNAVGLRPQTDVVDLCSGDGWFTLQIARIARSVTAIDIDQQLLEVTSHRLKESGVTNVRLAAGDAYDLAEIVQTPVDLIFMANAFHGVPDPARLSSAVRLVIKPGGEFVVVNWHRRPREATTVLGEPRGPKSELRLTPEQTIASVKPSGLEFARLIDVPPYHYAIIFHR